MFFQNIKTTTGEYIYLLISMLQKNWKPQVATGAILVSIVDHFEIKVIPSSELWQNRGIFRHNLPMKAAFGGEYL